MRADRPTAEPEQIRIARSLRDALEQWSNDGCPISTALFCDIWSIDAQQWQWRTTAAKANYLALRGELLSYLPASKYDTSEPWTRNGRQEGKPAKIAKMLMHPDHAASYSDSDYEAFSNRVKARHALGQMPVLTISGEAIRDAYHPDNTDLDSCMNKTSTQSYLDLYVFNPDQIKMHIVKNPRGVVVGRALLWTDIDGKTIQDRCYGPDHIREALKAHAREHGAWTRANDSWDDETAFIDPSGRDDDLSTCIALDCSDHSSYPYADTFKYLCPDDDSLTNYYRSNTYTLNSTSGGPEFARRYECGECGETFRAEDPRRDPDTDAPLCPSCSEARQCSYCGAIAASGSLDDDDHCPACVSSYFTCRRCSSTEDRISAGHCRPCTVAHVCGSCDRERETLTDTPDPYDASRFVCDACRTYAIEQAARIAREHAAAVAARAERERVRLIVTACPNYEPDRYDGAQSQCQACGFPHQMTYAAYYAQLHADAGETRDHTGAVNACYCPACVDTREAHHARREQERDDRRAAAIAATPAVSAWTRAELETARRQANTTYRSADRDSDDYARAEALRNAIAAETQRRDDEARRCPVLHAPRPHGAVTETCPTCGYAHDRPRTEAERDAAEITQLETAIARVSDGGLEDAVLSYQDVIDRPEGHSPYVIRMARAGLPRATAELARRRGAVAVQAEIPF
jgi:hypothetical protein